MDTLEKVPWVLENVSTRIDIGIHSFCQGVTALHIQAQVPGNSARFLIEAGMHSCHPNAACRHKRRKAASANGLINAVCEDTNS